jgi:hypothetical protein
VYQFLLEYCNPRLQGFAAQDDQVSASLQQLVHALNSRMGKMQGLELLEPIGRGGFATVWKGGQGGRCQQKA